jgi:hypothetical protein
MENSEEQNFELIQRTIRTAQRQFADDSSSYLLWGSTISFACILQYVLIRMQYEYNFIGWAILIPVAVILQIIFTVRKTKTQKVRTHIETILSYMWMSFGISLAIVLFAMSRLQENTYPIVLCLYGISVFVSGGAMKMRSLIFGGIACWAFAIASFFVPFETQLLFLAAAVVAAYLIPGLVIRSRFAQAKAS